MKRNIYRVACVAGGFVGGARAGERASGKAAKTSGEMLLPIPFSALPLVFAVSPLACASSPSKPPATQAIIIHLNLAYSSSLSPLFKRLTECFRIDLFEESKTKVPWSSGCQLPHPLSPLPPPRNKHTTSRKRQFCFLIKLKQSGKKNASCLPTLKENWGLEFYYLVISHSG